MHNRKHPWRALALAAAVTFGVAGCGGGEDSLLNTLGSFLLSGVVAKGAVAGALVKVHPVRHGAIDVATTVVSSTTGADGSFSLTGFKPESGVRYVAVISADGSSTSARDEVTGQPVTLPGTFTMRAFLDTAGLDFSAGDKSGTVSLTPYSELAVAAAEKAGLADAANINQALSNVEKLVGFDPRTVQAKTTADAAAGSGAQAEREKGLAVMLAALSVLANDTSDNPLACGQPSLGERTDCVVRTLAASYSVGSTKPGGASGSESVALAAAVDSVLADATLSAGIPAAAVATLSTSLAGDGAITPGNSDGSAIAAAKNLFSDVALALKAMFGDPAASLGSTLRDGALRAESTRFGQVFDAQAPLDQLLRSSAVIVGGADALLDYREGRSTSAEGSRGAGQTSGNLQDVSAFGCTVYSDAAQTQIATAPGNAANIGCAVRYRADVDFNADGSFTTTTYRHIFEIVPRGASATEYDVVARIRRSTCTGDAVSVLRSCGSGTRVNDSTFTDFAAAYSSVLTLTRHAGGEIASFAITGDLPPMFNSDGASVYNPGGKASVVLRANRSAVQQVAGALQTVEVVGDDNVTAVFKAGQAEPDGSLLVKAGTKGVTRLLADGSPASEAVEATVKLRFGNATGEAEGELALTDSRADRSGTLRATMKNTFTGALRNKVGSSVTEFFNGTVTLEANAAEFSGSYDATLPESTSNQFGASVSVSGSFRAAGAKPIVVSLAFSGRSFDAVATLSGQLNVLNPDGSPLRTVNLSGNNGATPNLSFKEIASGIAITLVEGQPLTDVLKGAAKVGVLNADTSTVTFTDGSFFAF